MTITFDISESITWLIIWVLLAWVVVAGLKALFATVP